MKSFDERLHHLIKEALQEDVGDGDHSTLSSIPADKKGKAVLKIKQDGCAGRNGRWQKRSSVLKKPGIVFTAYKKDGDVVHNGEKAFEVEASVHTILTCERLVLNCMQRMSGIATLTHRYTEKLKGYHTRLLDTRKTTPNFACLKKKRCGLAAA
jgi:nicotinate-nucleotide pyrophosphorylase (carboxylating)